MNSIELICQIKDEKSSSGEVARFLVNRLKIDGKMFGNKFAIDMKELSNSCRFDGEFEILTCSCGVAACTGITEGIHVAHRNNSVQWKVRHPISWPVHKELPKNITYREYTFDRNQYVEAIRIGVEKGGALLRYDEEHSETIQTGPYGFTTYDFESLSIRPSGACSSMVNKALEFSAKAHLAQKRKGTDILYITHPFAVGMILANAGCPEEVVVAGILHDTVEDTNVTLEQIEGAFGEEVAAIVAGCSEPYKELSWEERKQHTLDELKSASLAIQSVACADKLHNISSMIDEHRQIGDELWMRFKRGKAQQSWYYHGLLDSLLGRFCYEPLYRELKHAVESLFGRHQYYDDMICRIVSGGQTGADRAALDVALEMDVVAGGWCPAGRRAEDGIIPDAYPLEETVSRNYATRTRRNVQDSDGTLILNMGELDGGTLKTIEHAERKGKPCLLVQLDDKSQLTVADVKKWVMELRIRTLNVAGPRESKRPGIYCHSKKFLVCLLELLRDSSNPCPAA